MLFCTHFATRIPSAVVRKSTEPLPSFLKSFSVLSGHRSIRSLRTVHVAGMARSLMYLEEVIRPSPWASVLLRAALDVRAENGEPGGCWQSVRRHAVRRLQPLASVCGKGAAVLQFQGLLKAKLLLVRQVESLSLHEERQKMLRAVPHHPVIFLSEIKTEPYLRKFMIVILYFWAFDMYFRLPVIFCQNTCSYTVLSWFIFEKLIFLQNVYFFKVILRNYSTNRSVN